MKYLKIEKSVLNDGTVYWHLSTGNLSVQGSKMHRFILATRLLENGKAIMNKNTYEIHGTTFKAYGKPVYIVCVNGKANPDYIMYYNAYYKKWEVESNCIIDEDLPLFEKYGYIDNKK